MNCFQCCGKPDFQETLSFWGIRGSVGLMGRVDPKIG